MVAAPGFHAVRFEDDRVRVLDGCSNWCDGACAPHRWGGVEHILASSDFVRCDPEGNVLADTRASKTQADSGNSGLGRAALAAHFPVTWAARSSARSLWR